MCLHRSVSACVFAQWQELGGLQELVETNQQFTLQGWFIPASHGVMEAVWSGCGREFSTANNADELVRWGSRACTTEPQPHSTLLKGYKYVKWKGGCSLLLAKVLCVKISSGHSQWVFSVIISNCYVWLYLVKPVLLHLNFEENGLLQKCLSLTLFFHFFSI